MTSRTSSQPWTADDLLALKYLSDARISPDGARVAFTVREAFTDGTKQPRSRIWLAEGDGSGTRQYTSGPRADFLPRWSPDAGVLAFLSDREEDGKSQPYTIPASGGEAQRLVETQGSVVDLQWSPDGRTLALLVEDGESEEERARKEQKDDAVEFERNPKFQRVWVVDANGSNLRLASTSDTQVWEMAWFPDGSRLALVCSALPYEWSWYQSYVATLPLEGGEPQRIHGDRRQVAWPLPSPDGSLVAFITAMWSDRGVVSGDVYVVPAEGGEASCLTQGYPASFSWAECTGQDSLLALGYEDGEAAVFRISTTSGPERLWKGEAGFALRHWARATLSADQRRLAVIREDPTHPPDVYTADLDDTALEWRRLTEMQSHLKEMETGSHETLRWRSTDGREIRGILLKPSNGQAEPLPLITIVHGGPTALYSHSFISSYLWASMLVSAGYAVFLPNPRGSTGFGKEYAEANLGDMGGMDLQDVLAGVDAIVASGAADPDRLGVGGWSYGGFMTSWIVTQTDRFRAAVMGAGVSNWRSFHGVSNLPTWDTAYYNDDDPYRAGGLFDRFSSVLSIDEVRTPTLIIHGEADPYVPVGQGYEFFRAMKERGVEVEMVVYPREGHGISEKAHLKHMLNRAVEWYKSRVPVGAAVGAGSAE